MHINAKCLFLFGQYIRAAQTDQAEEKKTVIEIANSQQKQILSAYSF